MPFDAALTAWATLGLAAFAIATVIFAGLAWKSQAGELQSLKELNEKQIPVLEGQQAELETLRRLREREEQERRERFVSQVFCWQEIGPDHRVLQAQIAAGVRPGMVSSTYVRNTGTVPVYDLSFGWWIGDRLDTFSNRVTPLTPPDVEIREGESSAHWHQAIPPGTDTDTIRVAVFMRDAAGNRWRIRPGGHYELYTDDMLPPGTWTTT
jgi:hypothetical protein